MTALLETNGLSVSFGLVRAVDQVDLRVDAGTLVGLIGPNGAGKTTFIDALSGFVASSGAISFGGRDISDLPAHRRAHAGLGRTWQSLELFDGLSVRENLMVAAQRQSIRGLLHDLVRPKRHRSDTSVVNALRAVGIEFGRIIAHGAPAEIRTNPAVIEAYLGSASTGDSDGRRG